MEENNLLEAGREVFILQCYACHTVRGANNDIVSRTSAMSFSAMLSYIKAIHEIRYFMPPFAGNDAEARALAVYIVNGLHGKNIQEIAAGDKGEEVFAAKCAMCHTLRGGANPLLPKISTWNQQRIRKALDMLDKLKGGVMPPLIVPPADKDALADFLFTSKEGGEK